MIPVRAKARPGMTNLGVFDLRKAFTLRNSDGTPMSNAPPFDIDVPAFWADPYPALAKMRREAPIAFVPQLGSTCSPGATISFSQEKRHRRVLVASAGRPDE